MVRKKCTEYKPKQAQGKRDREGNIGKMVRESISGKVTFACRSERREQAMGISGGTGCSGLEIERGLMLLRNRKEFRVAGVQ